MGNRDASGVSAGAVEWRTSNVRPVTFVQGGTVMRPEDLLEWVRAKPFRPFRIVLNSGRPYEIRHPEMLRVGRTSMHVYSFLFSNYLAEQVLQSDVCVTAK